jgi:hypothetical protein
VSREYYREREREWERWRQREGERGRERRRERKIQFTVKNAPEYNERQC